MLHIVFYSAKIIWLDHFRSQSAIPTTRNNDLTYANPRLTRSRHSVRSMKKQAPTPPGPPPKTLLHGINPDSLALLTSRNIIPNADDVEGNENARPSAPTPEPGDSDRCPPSPLDNRDAGSNLPYLQHDRSSPKYNNADPIPPLTLLSLDNSYSQPSSRPDRSPTRNYHSRSRGNSECEVTTPSLPSTPVHGSPAPGRGAEAPAADSPVRPMSTVSHSDDDDMLIMRPLNNARPFVGYAPSEFNPGSERSPYTGYPRRNVGDIIPADSEEWQPDSWSNRRSISHIASAKCISVLLALFLVNP